VRSSERCNRAARVASRSRECKPPNRKLRSFVEATAPLCRGVLGRALKDCAGYRRALAFALEDQVEADALRLEKDLPAQRGRENAVDEDTPSVAMRSSTSSARKHSFTWFGLCIAAHGVAGVRKACQGDQNAISVSIASASQKKS